MINKYVLLSVTLVAVFSCTTRERPLIDSEKNNFIINLDSLPLLPLSAIDTIFYIPLETTDDALIGLNPVIRFGKSEFYVTFSHSSRIIKYDMKGKVQAVIDHKGPSNEEYMKITDFFVTEEALWIYDSYLNVLFQYDTNGVFKSKLKLDADIGSGIIPYKDKFLIMRNNPSQVKKALYVLDSKGKQKEAYLDDKHYNIITLPAHNQLVRKDDYAYIYSLFDTNIYCYDGERLSVKYSFDFGKKNVLRSFVNENLNNRSLLEDLCDVNGKIWGFESPAFIDNWTYIGLRQGIFIIKIFINEKTKKIYKFDDKDDLFFFTNSIWTVHNDYFVTTMLASSVSCMKMYKDKLKTEHNIRLMHVDVDEESNPVVCFIRFKKDFQE